jgi:L-alanine-DL-glutamate epimerase-like enolase superfamily enzyme
MYLSYSYFPLELKHTFRIADFERNSTPVVFVRLEEDGLQGYGEASMPPYLSESKDTCLSFLSKVDVEKLHSNRESREYLNHLAPGNNAAKAAIDIALHDLRLKQQGISAHNYFSADLRKMPPTSFTLGIDTMDKMAEKIKDAAPFSCIKIKLGSEDDQALINGIRKLTDKPILVDANRGWASREFAAKMIDWLSNHNCLLVEQPMPVAAWEDMQWLKSRSALPLFADESCKTLADLPKCMEVFHGINIKLMKSTGLLEAHEMILKAKENNMKLMIGCMSESSCGISAAAALAPLCDFADLDSTWLITNNPFAPMQLEEGKIKLSDEPGLGIQLENQDLFS